MTKPNSKIWGVELLRVGPNFNQVAKAIWLGTSHKYSLRDAIDMVEHCPVVVMTGLTQKIANELKTYIEASGAECLVGEYEEPHRILYNVELLEFGPSKVEAMKLYRLMTDADMAATKEIFSSAPLTLCSLLTKERAEPVKRAFEDVGATVVLNRIESNISFSSPAPENNLTNKFIELLIQKFPYSRSSQ